MPRNSKLITGTGLEETTLGSQSLTGEGLSSLLSDTRSAIGTAARTALNKLDEMEKEILLQFFVDERNTSEISDDLNMQLSEVNDTRLMAVNRFKQLLVIECMMVGLPIPGMKCPFCRMDNTEELNEWVQTWLKDNRYRFRGIMAAVKRRFGFTIGTMADLVTHIKFHLETPIDLQEKESLEDSQQFNLRLPVELRKQIDDLAKASNLPASEVLRECVRFGIPFFQGWIDNADTIRKMYQRLNATLNILR